MKDEIKLLKKQLSKLLREVEQLRVENVQLKAENKELRGRLGLNSETSHKPPSSDGYKKKPVEAGIPKEEGKKNGGQKGHKGKTLERVSEADKIELHHPSNCECCGRKFEAEEGLAHYELARHTAPSEVASRLHLQQAQRIFEHLDARYDLARIERLLRQQREKGG